MKWVCLHGTIAVPQVHWTILSHNLTESKSRLLIPGFSGNHCMGVDINKYNHQQ